MSSGINITLTRGNVEEHKTVFEANYESMYTAVQQAQEVGAELPDYYHKDKRMMLKCALSA